LGRWCYRREGGRWLVQVCGRVERGERIGPAHAVAKGKEGRGGDPGRAVRGALGGDMTWRERQGKRRNRGFHRVGYIKETVERGLRLAIGPVVLCRPDAQCAF
jgi:hypothetical protein